MKPLTLQGNGIAAAEVTVVKTNQVPVNSIFTALSILAMDLDNTIATLVEIGISDGTSLTPLDATPGPFAAGTSMTIYWSCVLQTGQCVYAKFSTPSAGDRLRVIAHGYVINSLCDHEHEHGY